MKGESDDMSVASAVDLIRATPQSRRTAFSKEIWNRRKQRYGSTGRAERGPVDVVPGTERLNN
jgi:hypothetical protein